MNTSPRKDDPDLGKDNITMLVLREGRPYMGYIGMWCCEGYGFRDKSESLSLGEGIIFQETDQLAEDFSLV